MPEFHQDCWGTFLASSISKFQFIRKKSKFFQGVYQKLSIPPIDPRIGKKLPLTYLGIVRKFKANQKNLKQFSPKNGGWGNIDPLDKIGLRSLPQIVSTRLELKYEKFSNSDHIIVSWSSQLILRIQHRRDDHRFSKLWFP